ncbi:MarR family winged helix-turn-helix transcriptional regulator [Saccharicrinis sp. FJH62]|uniref:MarR family winged helix-turn-helix transcriptional regulator n=1 Tax=Saccharicrinis sp. FJH62 TaxID=3344657 RepID=UPI0035D43394
MMKYEQLKLSNQICFPVYAASRLIIREYQPYLDKLGITYPQYLVLMTLWEQDGLTVNEIGSKLILKTNTLTPLLKRMEVMGLLTRQKAIQDERKVIVKLTSKGKFMMEEAAEIPEKLVADTDISLINIEELIDLKNKLYQVIEVLSKKQTLHANN